MDLAGVAAVALAYLGGSVSFPYWIGRARGVDLRAVGSRKLGGSNLWKSVGAVEGTLGGLLDALKGFAALVVAGAVGLPVEIRIVCGLAAVCGQLWPVFHRFDGGRANATAWGLECALDPLALVVTIAPVAAASVARATLRPRPTRAVPIASLLSFALFPVIVAAHRGGTPAAVAGVATLALILLRRLSAGLRADLATGASVGRVLWNRALFDRSELQERGAVAI